VPAGPGANDNASGTAVVIEIARAMAADGVLDDVCFALFGAEEIGLIGSAHYVRSLPAEQLGQIEAMLNFDMLGVGSQWPLDGSQSLLDIVSQEAEDLGIPVVPDRQMSSSVGGSDHASFIEQGVPAVIFNCFCDPNYHSADDRFEFVVEDRLAEAGAIGMATVATLLAQ
jgi:aminopeptidase YwaD